MKMKKVYLNNRIQNRRCIELNEHLPAILTPPKNQPPIADQDKWVAAYSYTSKDPLKTHRIVFTLL